MIEDPGHGNDVVYEINACNKNYLTETAYG